MKLYIIIPNLQEEESCFKVWRPMGHSLTPSANDSYRRPRGLYLVYVPHQREKVSRTTPLALTRHNRNG